MSSNSPTNPDNQEIDLSQVSRKLGQAYENFLSWVFRGFLFVKRNIIILAILFIIGAGLGFYLDKEKKGYENKIIVTANFGSINYLYSKVQLLQSKINENDSIYLKNTGISDYKNITEIKIEPIIDIYKFISANEQNFEFVKLLAENDNLNDVIKDDLTSRNYPFHTISFFMKNKVNEESMVNSLMKFFNDNDFYSSLQKESYKNIQMKINQNDSIINQIDRILNNFSKNLKSDKLVYNNENNQLNDVIKTKEGMIQLQGNLRIDLLNLDKTIKENSHVLNIERTKPLKEKKIILFPLLFLGLFLAIRISIKFYKNQALKVKS
ncbi:hypothetical protein [Flavobacterium microcysteis]|uniref:Uncharacterized protein n=1 Tax=Flavobacterium microcysteis TaxID=2596891 RepID=A0A501QH20_9FLAO|nr:hypothetical protein [Flavobacterium microcysteis]TPD71953.1 hypothetical protein FJA49_03465 [Flavobacterium microcysteis]